MSLPEIYATVSERHVPIAQEFALSLEIYARDEFVLGKSPHTVRQRLNFLRRFVRSATDGVTPPVVADFLATPGWSIQTRACAAKAIRSWLRWAHRNGLPPDKLMNPEDVQIPTVPRRHARPVNDDVIAGALDRCDDRTGLMILLGREAGLRRAEISRVHTDDLLPGDLLLVHGKGSKERIVPLTAGLAAEIATHPRGWLFPDPRQPEHPVRPRVVGVRVTRALGVATTHQLRHRFAMANYEASGHDIRAVQTLLGHSDLNTTANYLGVSQDTLRRSVAAASFLASAAR